MAKSHQETAEEFFMFLGQCIGSWAGVDHQLFQIFQYCVGPRRASSILYYRISSLDTRFNTTDELIESIYLQHPDQNTAKDALSQWTNAKSGYQSLLETRRRIAHDPVVPEYYPTVFAGELNGRALNTPPPVFFKVVKNQNEKLRRKESNKPAMKVSDLQKHLEGTMALQDRLFQFFQNTLTKHVEAYTLRKFLPHPPGDQ